jgi:hypothetical protein
MGYCMEQRDGMFKIKAENVAGAFAAIKSMLDVVQIMGGGGSHEKRHYSWVINENLAQAATLQNAMYQWRWQVYEDVETEDVDCPIHIQDIQFIGEKLGDDGQLFDAIAPFVEAGSYIEMSGEDGCLWRWIFDGKSCEEVQAKVTWE